MGFKLIRDKAELDRQKSELLYLAELEKEIRRWTNITNNNGERERKMLDRFSIVKSSPKHLVSPDDTIDSLANTIKERRMDLVQAQGNMDIDKLLDLLS
jgi:hypothetical protein